MAKRRTTVAQLEEVVNDLKDRVNRAEEKNETPRWKKPVFYIPLIVGIFFSGWGTFLTYDQRRIADEQRIYDIQQGKRQRLVELIRELPETETNLDLLLSEALQFEGELRKQKAEMPYVQHVVLAEAATKLGQFLTAENHYDLALEGVENTSFQNRDIQKFRIYLGMFDLYREWSGSFYIPTRLAKQKVDDITEKADNLYKKAMTLVDSEVLIGSMELGGPEYWIGREWYRVMIMGVPVREDFVEGDRKDHIESYVREHEQGVQIGYNYLRSLTESTIAETDFLRNSTQDLIFIKRLDLSLKENYVDPQSHRHFLGPIQLFFLNRFHSAYILFVFYLLLFLVCLLVFQQNHFSLFHAIDEKLYLILLYLA